MIPFTFDPDSGRSLKDALEAHFGEDVSYGIALRAGSDENDEDECLRFPSGGHAAVCTNYAMAVFSAVDPSLEPRLVWIGDRQSPEAKIVSQYESHDFCIVGGRYIIDAWAKNLEEYTPRAVLDLCDPIDQALIGLLYGSERCFNHNAGLEGTLRARAVQAASFPSEDRTDTSLRRRNP
jgi:hypothetical protein